MARTLPRNGQGHTPTPTAAKGTLSSPSRSRPEPAVAAAAGDNGRTAPPLPRRLPTTSAAAGTTPGQFSLAALVGAELGWGQALQWRRPSRAADHAINFLRVPPKLERFISFGHAVCADLFLFHFTWLPLRFCASLFLAVRLLAEMLLLPLSRVLFGYAPRSSRRHFNRASVYDLLKGAILITATLVLGSVQISRVYHYIRGEAVIKLYVVYNVLGVVDALFSSLGQDIMDALYRTTRDHLLPFEDDDADDGGGAGPRCSPTAASAAAAAAAATVAAAANSDARRAALLRLATHFFVAVAYVTLHSCVIFVQIVCLNVAMNSKNNALLTLLVSSNFVELKGTVFKRFEAENLFQVACSDAVERFILSLFLVLIGLQELSSFAAVQRILPSILVIWGAEVLVDYVKHSFTSKFNRLSADLFTTFSAILAHDLIAVRQRMASSLDPTHACVRRLGLATLPLACVVLRMAFAKIGPSWLPRLHTVTGLVSVGLFVACLFASKLLLNMLLLLHAGTVIREQQEVLARAVAARVAQDDSGGERARRDRLAAAGAGGALPVAAVNVGAVGGPSDSGPPAASDTGAIPPGLAASSLPGSGQQRSFMSLGDALPTAAGLAQSHHNPPLAAALSSREGLGSGGDRGVLSPARSGRRAHHRDHFYPPSEDAAAAAATRESLEALLMMESISTVDRWHLRAKMIPL